MSEKKRTYNRLGVFAPTFYRILDESASEWKDEARTGALLTVNGKLVEHVTPSFKRQLDIEGSARLRDGASSTFIERLMEAGGIWSRGTRRLDSVSTPIS